MAQGKLSYEKRKHERKEKVFDVTYKLMPKNMQENHPQKKGKTQDLSIGGLKIDGELIGHEGDVLRIEFTPKHGENPITVLGEIKWIRKANGTGQFGLAFVKLQVDEKITIEEILEA